MFNFCHEAPNPTGLRLPNRRTREQIDAEGPKFHWMRNIRKDAGGKDHRRDAYLVR
jgi:hypothetical protein